MAVHDAGTAVLPAAPDEAWPRQYGRTARGAPEGLDPSSAQVSAKRRFGEAVTAVGGGLSDILWRVVCSGEGLETAERALGWPQRAGKVVLLLALDRLAEHYQLR